jgi:hypothetical protein
MYNSEGLIGLVIQAVELSPDKETLTLFGAGGVPLGRLVTTGDCCSHSWIEHVEGEEHLLGQPIRRVEEVYLSRQDHPEFDCLQSYSFKIWTDRGICDIEFRNSSNGYYGGEIEFHAAESTDG